MEPDVKVKAAEALETAEKLAESKLQRRHRNMPPWQAGPAKKSSEKKL